VRCVKVCLRGKNPVCQDVHDPCWTDCLTIISVPILHSHADSHSECRSNPGSVCAMHSTRTMIQVNVYLKEDEPDRADCGVPPPSDAPVCDRGVCEGLLRVIALISFFIKMRQSHSIGSAHMRLKKASETQWRQKLVPRCPRDSAIMIVTSSMAHVF